MEAITYIRLQYADMRRFFNNVFQDLTEEQLNWAPPGKANSIASTLLHTIGGEDMFFQQIIQGKPTLWETQGWSKRFAIPNPPGDGLGWKEAAEAHFQKEMIFEYMKVVQSATDSYLACLNDSELVRTIKVFGRDLQIAEILALQVTHITEHGGEIAAIKGIHGEDGLPF